MDLLINKNEGTFVLKIPTLIIIFYRMRVLGLTDYITEKIESIILSFFAIVDQTSIYRKKTMKEIYYILDQMEELKVFFPDEDCLDRLKVLADNFFN